MKLKVVGIVLLLTMCLPFVAAAQEKDNTISLEGWVPLQISLWNPVQLFNSEKNVYGLRMTLLYSKNKDIYGFDLGPGLKSARDVGGVQISGIGNTVEGSIKGIQVGGLFNLVKDDVTGIQIGGLINTAKKIQGIQVGGLFTNEVEDVKGIQIGGWSNVVKKEIRGLQIAVLTNNLRLSPLYAVVGVAAGAAGANPGVAGGAAGSTTNNVEHDYTLPNVFGLQVAFAGNFAKNVCGGQIVLGANLTPHLTGSQIAGIMNTSWDLSGVQIGLFNRIGEAGVLGMYSERIKPQLKKEWTQYVDINKNKGCIKGVQIGIVNVAEKVRGVQIGVINYCKKMYGVQIGVVNIIKESTLPFFPIANANFAL